MPHANKVAFNKKAVTIVACSHLNKTCLISRQNLFIVFISYKNKFSNYHDYMIQLLN